MITTILLICGLLGVGILLGMDINSNFSKKVYEELFHTGWKRGYECGWEDCKCGKERKNSLDRMYEYFEKEVNNEL